MEEINVQNIPVSVIVPVYNTKPYLEKCVRSLFAQTLKGIEYVFFDDASSDGSLEELYSVVERYRRDDNHVIIEHFDCHQGQANLRRLAKQISSGDYIFHCDSDDWIDPDLISEMYKIAVAEDCDIVTCDLKYIFEDGSSRIWEQNSLSARNLCSGIIRAQYTGSLCNKLIRREVLFKNEFIQPTENMGEDWACSVQYAFFSEKVGYVRDVKYNYLRHQGTSSNSDDIEDIFERHRRFVCNFGIVNSFMKQYDKAGLFHNDVVYRCLNLRFQLLPYMENPESIKLWRETCPEYGWEIFMLQGVPMKDKLIYAMVNVGVYQFLKRLMKRNRAEYD